MNAQNPLVTVLLPVYNCEKYIRQSVQSIVEQTSDRWHLLVINDGSSDGSQAVLEEFENDPRITILHQENRGLSATLNRGLDLCETKYVARMDADDIAFETRLEKQIEFLETHPEVGLVGSQICRLGERRCDSGSHLPTTHDEIISALLTGQHAMCHPAIMCRMEGFDQVGKYTSGLGEEWDMYLRFGEKWQLANIDEPLLRYRFHSASINGKSMGELRRRIRHACECSRRRTNGQEPPTYDQFVALESKLGFVTQFTQRIEDLSRAYYHSSVADILGNAPVRGYFRLSVAALLSPHLTARRIWQKIANSS